MGMVQELYSLFPGQLARAEAAVASSELWHQDPVLRVRLHMPEWADAMRHRIEDTCVL